MLNIVRRVGELAAKEVKPKSVESSSDSSGSSSNSSSNNSTNSNNEDTHDDEKANEETWVDWMVRTAHLASSAMKKARIPDWIEEQNAGNGVGLAMCRDELICGGLIVYWVGCL